MTRLPYTSWITGDSDKEPFMLHFRCSKTFIVFTVSMAVFTDIFLYAVIVPVLPFAIHERVGVAQEDIQYWVSILLACYGAALLVISPICGWISDRITMRRLPFITGLLTLAGATAFLAAGRSIALLIIGRILQGASAAIVWVVGLSVIVDTVGQKDVGQFMGYVSIAMSLGLLTAPLLGGIVFDQAGYMAVFAMCFGLLGVDVVLRLLMIERKVAKKWIPSLDSRRPSISHLSEQYQRSRPGTPFTTTSQKSLGNGRSRSTSATLCDSRRQSLEYIQLAPVQPAGTAPSPRPNYAGHRRNPSIAEAANRILSDSPRRESPGSVKRPFSARLPPVITLLASRRLLAALWASLVQATLLTAFDSTLPIRVRNIFGWDSLGAGLIFLPVMLPTFISPLLGWISDRYGNKWLCAVGFLISTPFLVLLRLVIHKTFTQKAVLCVLLFFFGLTITLAFAPLMAEITYVVEAKENKAPPGTYGKYGAYAQAYGLFNVFFAGGCLVGPIWGGMIKDASEWGTMCWTLGLLSGFTALPCLIWTGGFVTTTWRVKRKRRELLTGSGYVAEEPRPRLPRLDGNGCEIPTRCEREHDRLGPFSDEIRRAEFTRQIGKLQTTDDRGYCL